MKTLLTLFTAMVVSTSSMASNVAPVEINVKLGENKKIEVLYKSETENFVSVEILNEKKGVVYSEKIKSGNFIRPYDLTELKDGRYYVKISDGKSTTVEEVFIGEVKIPLPKDLQHVRIYKIGTSKKCAISVVTGKAATFKISIKDSKNRLLYNEVEMTKKSFGRVYNLEKAKTDEYTIEVRNSRNELIVSKQF